MYEFNPYFTNDGSVGLFSKSEEDIYHSAYGALTESRTKFILPSHLEDFLKNHDSVKILDLCYGIGYNTKSALKVFLENINQFDKKNSPQKKIKNNFCAKNSTTLAPIDTDNIQGEAESKKNFYFKNFEKNKNNNLDFCNDTSTSIVAIDGDNILEDKIVEKDKNLQNSVSENQKYNNKCIKIDAVDNDEFLVKLSPFITSSCPKSFLVKNFLYKKLLKKSLIDYKSMHLRGFQNEKLIPLKNEYKINNEIEIIILLKMLEKNPQIYNDENLKKILTQKEYSMYFDKFMLNLASFYENDRYKLSSAFDKSTFLHNIYYRYVSNSHKMALSALKFNDFDINFHVTDARNFVKNAIEHYDFIFLDAFSPSKCPALWSLEFFSGLYNILDTNGMIVTYSNSASVRNAFFKAGFSVGKIFDRSKNKYQGTVAVKNENLIDHPLNAKDIALMNSKAGIVYHDNESLSLNNSDIINFRNIEFEKSSLMQSSTVMKGFNNG